MEIVERQEAIDKRIPRYFTGRPCKRGHISERYTQMSACIDCLHPTFDGLTVAQRREKRERLIAVAFRMVRIKIRLHKNDLDLFEAMALAAAMAREPLLSLKHIRTRWTPKVIGTGWSIYAFMCFPDDEKALRAFQDSLESVRRPHAVTNASIAAGAQQRLQRLLADEDAAAAKRIPEFRP